MRDDIKKNLLRKKIFMLALTYVFFGMAGHINAKMETDRIFCYELEQNLSRNNDGPFAEYKDFKIYIGSDEYLSKYLEDIKNICVCDDRDGNNPNMKIYNSYRITSIDDMFNILGVLLEYEKQYPSDWNRSLKGLQIEWDAHNISYEYGVFPDNSGSVDLDNRDGFFYENDIIKLILGK